MSGLTDEQVDAILLSMPEDVFAARNVMPLFAVVASLLAAARAEGAEKARVEVRESVESALHSTYPTYAVVCVAVRAALAGGERDE